MMTQTGPRSGVRTAIGFDIGGTKIACGVIANNGERIETARISRSPGDSAETLDILRQAVHDLRARHPSVTAIGVGAAGLVEWPDGYIRWAPNNAYHDMPLRQLLEETCGLPTVVDNDANAAAWAEVGMTTSSQYALFITIGTGVGGGLVLNGQMYRGNAGFGGEIGHITVDPNGGIRCGCGNIGCLEAVASGTALGRYGRQVAAQDPQGLLSRLAGGAEAVTGEAVSAAAVRGDAAACEIFIRIGTWLGIAIASIIAVLDLQTIILGGGVAAAGSVLLDPTRDAMNDHLFARSRRTQPHLVLARHGNDAGWMGAGLLALSGTTPRR